VEQNCPKEMAWKVNLYRGYLAICNPDDHHLNVVITGTYEQFLKMICNDFLVVKVNCWSNVFNIIESI